MSSTLTNVYFPPYFSYKKGENNFYAFIMQGNRIKINKI